MLDSVFSTIGSLFASGPALLLLAVLAALIPLAWDWRVTLAALVTLHVAVSLLLAYLHRAPAILTISQLVAILVAASLLALAQWLRRREPPPRQPAGWLVRLMALAFVIAAWWFLDPGIGLPMMSQPEVDLLVWIAICALFVTTLTADPLFAAAALLLWLLPAYAFAIVLLPTTGMPALLGIAEILVALASAYLILLQPQQRVANDHPIPVPLPRAPQTVRPLRLPGLRPPRPTVTAARPLPFTQPPAAPPLAEDAERAAAPVAPRVESPVQALDSV